MLFTYVIEARGTGYVKIGHSDDPHRRRYELQVGCPYDLELLAFFRDEFRYFEQWCRHYLKQWRIRGEWYRKDNPVKDILLIDGKKGDLFARTLPGQSHWGYLVFHNWVKVKR
jgi:hypothetical protein